MADRKGNAKRRFWRETQQGLSDGEGISQAQIATAFKHWIGTDAEASKPPSSAA